MSHASLERLSALSRSVIERSALAPVFRNVHVTTPDDLDDEILFRIMITVADADPIDTAAAASIKRDLEKVLAEADDRVPSIRFAEAA